jgi:hypothetical protein
MFAYIPQQMKRVSHLIESDLMINVRQYNVQDTTLLSLQPEHDTHILIPFW